MDEFILFFKIVIGKIASAARNLINSSPQTEAMTFVFSSVFILLLCPNCCQVSLWLPVQKKQKNNSVKSQNILNFHICAF